MKKSFKLFLALLLTSGFALSSCSDKEVNDSNIEIPGDPYGKTTETGEALFNILGAAGDLDSLPDNWKSNNFTVEPTIGKVMDESNPYVRTTASESTQEAIDIFNGYTGSDLSSDATSGSWSKEGVGSIQLNVINKDGVFAVMNINIPQMPHLTQLRFVEKSLLGENDEEKTAYYKTGDVLKVEENGETSYWTCVRSCDPNHKKYTSHWVSFQLNKENYYVDGKQILPTKLGYNSNTDRMLKRTVELFAVLNDPSIYDEEHFPKGLGELGTTYGEEEVQTMASEWARLGLFKKVLPEDVVTTNRFSPEKLYHATQPDTIFFYVNGYHRPTRFNDITLDGTKVWMDKNNISHSKSFYSKWTPKYPFNISTYVVSGNRKWDGVQYSLYNGFAKTKYKALVVRYKTGSQLCGTTAKYDKPFTPASGITITEEYHYQPKATSYVIGDRVRDGQGSIWTCVLSPCKGNTKTIFVTTDNIKISSDGKRVINEDLPTIKDIFHLYPFLCFYQFCQITSDAYNQLIDPLLGAFPANDYLQLVQYLGDNQKTSHRTTFAVKSTSKDHQQLLRMYDDGSNVRNNTAIYKGFTTYQDKPNRKLYLEDAEDNLEFIKEVNAQDTLVNKFWLPTKNGPIYRTTIGHSEVSYYLYHRATNPLDEGFGDPDDHYSIFNEPVAIFRIKILEPGDGNDFERIQRTPLTDVIDVVNETLENWFTLVLPVWKDDCIFLDGKPYKISYTEK